MRHVIFSMAAVFSFSSAHAEMVKIPWHTSAQSSPWIPGNDYIDGWSKNFMDGTVEEKRKVRAEGELQADMMRPQGAKGLIPFVIMLHGCDGFGRVEKKWGRDYAVDWSGRATVFCCFTASAAGAWDLTASARIPAS